MLGRVYKRLADTDRFSPGSSANYSLSFVNTAGRCRGRTRQGDGARAFGAHYIANILRQQQVRRDVQPPRRLKDPEPNELTTDPLSLAEYDVFILRSQKESSQSLRRNPRASPIVGEGLAIQPDLHWCCAELCVRFRSQGIVAAHDSKHTTCRRPRKRHICPRCAYRWALGRGSHRDPAVPSIKLSTQVWTCFARPSLLKRLIDLDLAPGYFAQKL